MAVERTGLSKLRELLARMESLLIAYSGGVDSTFLLAGARDILPAEKLLAVTAASPLYPEEEGAAAGEWAARLGVRHIVVESVELDRDAFAVNPPDRCYHCKLMLFRELREMAAKQGLAVVADGSNVSDLDDYRPGRRALAELGIRSPLLEAGLTKDEIRQLSRTMGLPTWNKPAMACLASRFPYGTRITREGLEQVGAAERWLRGLGLGQLRVRHHGTVARIEVEAADLQTVMAHREKITAELRALGYTYVTLDLGGYRTGSMNEILEEQNHE